MAEFRLSERAERDLFEIYVSTDQIYGSFEAEAYYAGLERILDLLAGFPRIGPPVDEIAPGLRRYRFKAHAVFYTEDSGFILIRAVLHHARELKPDLLDQAQD